MTDTYVINERGQPVIDKDPDAKLDYTFDWTEWLTDVADTIASAVVTVPSGLTLESSVVTGGNLKVVAWISGGTAGKVYPIKCKITTSAITPRIDERTIYIKVVER